MNNDKILIIGTRQSGKTIRAANILRTVLNDKHTQKDTPKAVIVYLHESEDGVFWPHLNNTSSNLSVSVKQIKKHLAFILETYYNAKLFIVRKPHELNSVMSDIEKSGVYKQKILVIDNDMVDLKIKPIDYTIIKTKLGESMDNTEDYNYVFKCSLSLVNGRPVSSLMTYMKHPTLEVGTFIELPISYKV